MTATSRRVKVAFIVSRFPCYDEAFILREIHALAQKLDTVIFSLRNADTKQIVHDQARELLDRTLYLPYLSPGILADNLRMLLTRPLRYVRAFLFLLTSNLKSPQFLMRALVFFPKAVSFSFWAENNGITHVHAYWATYPASMAQVIKRLTGLRFSFMGHAHDIYLDTTGLAQKIREAEFISTCTSQNRDYLVKLAPEVNSDKVRIIYHGLNLASFEAAPEKKNEHFEILSVGTLQYYKGFDFLLQALAKLKQKGVSFHAVIIGGGPEEGNLKKLRAELGLESDVVMTGPLKQNEVIPYYKKADVSVLMAQSEWHWGIPNVLIESLAARTAVVTTRFGSVEELVQDGKTGLIVEAKNSEALAAALQRYESDPALRRAHAEAGNERVRRHFDLSRNIEEYTARYSS